MLCCFYLPSSPGTIISPPPPGQANAPSREAPYLASHSILTMDVMSDELFLWILYVWSLCLSQTCRPWAKSFCVGHGQAHLPHLIEENSSCSSLLTPSKKPLSDESCSNLYSECVYIPIQSRTVLLCLQFYSLVRLESKCSPQPSPLPIFLLSSSHLTHAFPKLTTVSWMGSPQKICPCPNPWNLLMWPYLEKVSLQM